MDQDQFSIADLRQYINGSRSLYAPIPPPLDLTPSINNPYNNNNNNMLVFRSDSTTNIGGASGAGEGFGGFDNGGGGRWPRQETLTLLEIRSRLDHKFKEANQKGPLWDEVSRILSEEHGYQRSGKKCREKFENLYKYYKKTKEGKAGRQDGKHYRFFRQLEALYGDTSNNSASASASETNLVGGNFYNNYPNKNTTSLANNDQDTSLSLSKFSDSHTTSSDDSDDNEGIYNKKRGKKSLKLKIKDFIDAQMRKLMDKQEAWMDKMMKTIEHKEQERMLREEEWRKQDAARIEMEHKFWASERAWIESRDASLMDTFQKLSGKVIRASPSEELMAANEIRSLSENGSDQTMSNNLVKGEIWHDQSEEIARKMASFGHDRSGLMCKQKWESVNNYALKCHKKRKEDSKGCNFYQNHESICSQGGGAYCEASDQQGVDHTIRLNIDHGNSNSTSNAMSESCFRYFMGDDYGRIMDWKH